MLRMNVAPFGRSERTRASSGVDGPDCHSRERNQFVTKDQTGLMLMRNAARRRGLLAAAALGSEMVILQVYCVLKVVLVQC